MSTTDTSDNLFTTNTDINRLTLELLVSNTKYKRHLAVCDPKLFETTQQKERQRLKYKSEIQALTRQLLDQATGKLSTTSPEIVVSKRIQHLFDTYMDECSTHFENMSQMTEPREEWEEYTEEQDETIFAHCDTPHPVKMPAAERAKSATPYYGMNMFMKRR
jgi:hypothetical protein